MLKMKKFGFHVYFIAEDGDRCIFNLEWPFAFNLFVQIFDVI